MVKQVFVCLALVVAAWLALPIAALAEGPANSVHEPTYAADGRLIPPVDYREWIFLSSGLDMSYNEKALASE